MKYLLHLLGVLVASACVANVIRVPEDYEEIQIAVNSCFPNDTVSISSGRYTENIVITGKPLSIFSESYINNDNVINVTIDGNSTLPSIYISNLQDDFVEIGGIEITGGGPFSCNIYGAISSGIHSCYGNLSIDKCRFTYNTFNEASAITLYFSNSCIISNSLIAHNGRALIIDNSNVIARNLTITNNNRVVDIRDNSSLEISKSDITNNMDYIVYESMYPCELTMNDVLVANNDVAGNELFLLAGMTANINACTFANNNCSIGFDLAASNLTISNSIFWSNYGMPFRLRNIPGHNSSNLYISYSDIEDGEGGIQVIDQGCHYYWQNGNFNENPDLDLDCFLLSNSPCIDSGDPSSPLDPDGTRADIGAYYYCQGEGIALPAILRTSTEPGYPEPITVTLYSSCDPVAIDSARTETGLFTLDSYPNQVAGEFQSGDFQLTFHPSVQGVFTDTLHIWADTDPPHHKIPLVGESGPIPAPVTDLSINILPDLSAQLTWSPVTQTIYGNPVTPDYYLIFYNEDNPANEDDWYYLYPVTSSTFTHPLVARFADVMNYRVVAWKGIDPAILGLRQGMNMRLIRDAFLITN